MQVSFSSVNKNTNRNIFPSVRKSDEFVRFSYPKEPSRDEVLTARTKKAVSEIRVIAMGLVAVYFAIKVKNKSIFDREAISKYNKFAQKVKS